MRCALLLALLTMGVAAPAAGGDGEAPRVRIYLPRERSVTVDPLTLGDVTIVASGDVDLQDAIQRIPLGRGPWSGEAVVVDRALVLSRLVAHGVDRKQVSLIGARKVQVRRAESTFAAEEVIAAARRALSADVALAGHDLWKAAEDPGELVYPKVPGAALTAATGDLQPDGTVAVEVAVVADGEELATASLTFRKGYRVRRVVATKDLPPGTPLTAGNIRFERGVAFTPRGEELEPYGKMPNRAVPGGSEITPAMLKPIEKKVLVRRNYPVVMQIDRPGFTIRTTGVALQEGRAGDLIKVRNTDSQAVVIARVQFDSTVEPLVQE